MNDENLCSLKEIAADMNLNWQTLRSWKEQFYTHIPMIKQGRQTKYKKEAINLFHQIRAMKEAGLSDSEIHEKLERNPVEEIIEPPLEQSQPQFDSTIVKEFQTAIIGLQEEIFALKAKIQEEQVSLRDYELMDQLRQIRETKKQRTSLFSRMFGSAVRKS